MTRQALAIAGVLLLWVGMSAAQQIADPDFDPTVARPAHVDDHPAVLLDEAHGNFHTADGRYKPFADLLRADGYRVVPGKRRLDAMALAGVRVLVIANAGAHDADEASAASAFDEAECDAVRGWVHAGGSLLLIADHAPFGAAAERLASRFDVGMGKGYAFDTDHDEGTPSTLVYSRDNGLLGEHAVLQGRDETEVVSKVVTFTGQSLIAPPGAIVLLKLGPGAREAPSREALQASESDPAAVSPAAGNAQGVALTHGRGRVVVLGEAAMFSAQVIRFENDGKHESLPMGMNVPGNDDRQFALNVMRWLSGALE